MRGTSFRQARLIIRALVYAAVPAVAVAADVSTKLSVNPPNSNQIERGQYLVMITGCHDCHTPDYIAKGSKTPAKDFLTGGTLGWRGPWGTTYPANLRLYFNRITEDQWIQVAKTIERRPPMPYYSLNAMAEMDVRAIYQYMSSLGPAGQSAPNFVPPDKEPPQPYVQFPMK